MDAAIINDPPNAGNFFKRIDELLNDAAQHSAEAQRLGNEIVAEFEQVVARLIDDPLQFDVGLVRRGPESIMAIFDYGLLRRFSSENFKCVEQLKGVLALVGTPTAPSNAARANPDPVGALIGLRDEILSFRQKLQTDGSQSAFYRVQSPKDPYDINALWYRALYVRRGDRSDRAKAAAGVVGVLGFIAWASGSSSFSGMFVVSAAYFGLSAYVTFDAEFTQETRWASTKDAMTQYRSRAQALVQASLQSVERQLEEVAQKINRLSETIRTLAESSRPTPPPPGSIVLGTCAVTPIVDRVAYKKSALSFSALTALPREGDTFSLAHLAEEARPIDGCLAYFCVADCDTIEVIVEESVDASAIKRFIVSSAMKAMRPGGARFMFVEPGRLAEAYRVFGSLNDAPATRLAERLYVTHVNEFAAAVDSLRTFVGRAKEVLTRRTEGSGRLGHADPIDAGSMVLPRAVVVLDETEHSSWPEKDARRLWEYFGELKSLAEVAVREGSVLLIHLRHAYGRAADDTPAELGYVHSSAAGGLRILARKHGFLLREGTRVIYPDMQVPGAIAAECDQWCAESRKAGSRLAQVGAKLDWSDTVASDSRYGLQVEVGRHSSEKPALLTLGRDGTHHAICIGRTGSGKTNLFHVVISNLVRRYSPDELELYLLDFKEGVEFAVYANLLLPHCRAVAIDADRVFGLSVLTHLRRELNRRANVFKQAGVAITSLERYEEETGQNMPRIVLLIDEFQVLLQAERTPGGQAGAAAAALEDLVRRGRSFGLHVIIGSQTLAGRELTAASLGQFAARIVLPCSAPDAAMLLGEQAVSSQLRTPGDAIVWTAGQGNVTDAHLAKIYAAELNDLPELAEKSREHIREMGRIPPSPFVFRGTGQNELSEVLPHLQEVRSAQGVLASAVFAVGSPSAYGERPYGRLEDRRSRHLLFVHRSDESRKSFTYSAIESLLRLQDDPQVLLCDVDLPPEEKDPIHEKIRETYDERVRILQLSELEPAIVELASRPPGGPRSVLVIAGAGRTNLSRSALFAKLLREGPEAGVHVIATCDSVRNLERLIERSLLPEFGMRLLGPAPAGDSQKLLDCNDAEGLTLEHQYLMIDDSAAGQIKRLQVVVSGLER